MHDHAKYCTPVLRSWALYVACLTFLSLMSSPAWAQDKGGENSDKQPSLLLLGQEPGESMRPDEKAGTDSSLDPTSRSKPPAQDKNSSVIIIDDFFGKREPIEINVGGVDTPHPAMREDIQGQLQFALGLNDLREAEYLLESGANPNKLPGDVSMTPLMLAESAEMVELLLRYGADPFARDKEGGTVLHYAVTKVDAVQLIRLFTSMGVNPDIRGWGGSPPLFIAGTFFHESRAFASRASMPAPRATLLALKKAGADLNALDSEGQTLLMLAATWDDAELAKTLVELGANKGIRNGQGNTAADMARELGHRHIHQFLQIDSE